MKLLKSIPVALAVFLTTGMTVFAGNINEHEQRVLDKVSEVVTYQDKEYQVKSSYVERLRAYMNQDNVDLTSAQADKAINEFYSNVGRGIREGYMEEVGGEQPSENDIGKDKPHNNKPGTGSTGSNTSDDSRSGTTDGAYAQGNSQTDTTVSEDTQNSGLAADENAAETGTSGTDAASDDVTDSNTAEGEKDSSLNHDKNSTDAENTGEADDQSDLTEEEIERLQKEREFVQRVLEENSMPEEEADVYAELEEAEAQSNAGKDYSDAVPFKKGINIGLTALIIALVFAVVMIGILWSHRNRHRRKK